MRRMLAFARGIDTLNERIGQIVLWLVLISITVAAINAAAGQWLGRYSNTLLESQWYLFAAIFLLTAGYTLKHNGHVRVDVLYGRFAPRTQAWIDLLGGLLFLLPLCVLFVWLSLPGFLDSFHSGEVSPDAGGLTRWPVRLLIPAGFALLGLQGIAEIIKRIAFLRGIDVLTRERPEEKA
jgi:TRAP-type mannitol/chloroaromatic compound transport system permease small subunit